MPSFVVSWSSIVAPFWVLLGLFVASSAVHLVFCFREMEKMRRVTKILPLLFLSIAFTIQFPNEWALWAALFSGMLGDFFLLWKKKQGIFFLVGVAFFFACHLFALAEYVFLTYPMQMGFYIAYWVYVGVFVLGMGYFCFRIVKKKSLIGPLTFYFAVLTGNLLMSIFAATQFSSSMLWIAVVGEALFLLSDAILGMTMFGKDVKRRDFYIMVTYLLAQLLIATGMGLSLLIS